MMIGGRFRTALLGIAGALTLSACAYDDYGYGGVSAGYGGGYYDGGYADYDGGYYDGGYYGAGYPSYGWYDGFYYPGTGYYIYDRGGNRRRWRDSDRRHWEGQRDASRRGWRGGDWDGRGNDGRGNDGRGNQGQVRGDDAAIQRGQAQAQARGWRGGDPRAVRPANPRGQDNDARPGTVRTPDRGDAAGNRGWRGGNGGGQARPQPGTRPQATRPNGGGGRGAAASRGWRRDN